VVTDLVTDLVTEFFWWGNATKQNRFRKSVPGIGSGKTWFRFRQNHISEWWGIHILRTARICYQTTCCSIYPKSFCVWASFSETPEREETERRKIKNRRSRVGAVVVVTDVPR
jgi:hypothetical protein